MSDQSNLARVAALLASDTMPRYLVTSYRRDGDVLAEIETVEAPTMNAALQVGQSAAMQHPTVIVSTEARDTMGIIQSAVIHTFDRYTELP